jgi:hypothetical protein
MVFLVDVVAFVATGDGVDDADGEGVASRV